MFYFPLQPSYSLLFLQHASSRKFQRGISSGTDFPEGSRAGMPTTKTLLICLTKSFLLAHTGSGSRSDVAMGLEKLVKGLFPGLSVTHSFFAE